MFIENLILALESLKANKLRALLTMLGIVMGIASVIITISIGDSLTISISRQLSTFGTTNIFVLLTEVGKGSLTSTSEVLGGGSGTVLSEDDLFTDEEIEKFGKLYSNSIESISFSLPVTSGTVRDGKNYANVSVLGVNTGYLDVNNVKMETGRFISQKDIDGYKNIAVVSDRLASSIFYTQDPLLKEIKVYNNSGIYTYTIVGVYKYSKAGILTSSGRTSVAEKDLQTQLFIPVSTAKQYTGTKGYSTFALKSAQGVNTLRFAETTEEYFKKLNRGSDWTVTTVNMENELATMIQIVDTVSGGLALLAAISLIVGGVGVMNIMLVSVTERTKEIGTRKALGARRVNIRSQFIIEAMFLSLIGGVLGVIVGLISATIAAPIIGTKMTVNIPVLTLCVLFSMGIGVFFGYYPAEKASKLDPIEALRYE
ncbi:MAG: ABC transporter permease [Clostridiales bacterium]|jgi:putative ABC transport system permease protein|nr:ABC transporter permease [Clostridiales bacterium]